MKVDAQEVVAGVVMLNGGTIRDRTRLQEQVFLLDRCGANLGLVFTYQGYRPYSVDVTDGWLSAKADGQMEVEECFGRHKVAYSIFRSTDAEAPAKIGDLPAERVKLLLEVMREASDVTLELAAAMEFLRNQGFDGRDIDEELKARKPHKATEERIGRAHELLSGLGL